MMESQRKSLAGSLVSGKSRAGLGRLQTQMHRAEE